MAYYNDYVDYGEEDYLDDNDYDAYDDEDFDDDYADFDDADFDDLDDDNNADFDELDDEDTADFGSSGKKQKKAKKAPQPPPVYQRRRRRRHPAVPATGIPAAFKGCVPRCTKYVSVPQEKYTHVTQPVVFHRLTKHVTYKKVPVTKCFAKRTRPTRHVRVGCCPT